MAYEIPTGEPVELTVGDLVKWKIPEDPDFPISDSWILKYAIVKAGSNISITCTDNGDNHFLATVTAADSAKWSDGTYRWQSYISKGAERYKVSNGSMVIKPNFEALVGGYDDRSHWRIVLENVEAVLQNRATKDQSSYTINGRQLSRTSIPDLIMLYNKARSAVVSEEAAERIAKGLGHPGTIRVRFSK